MYFWVEMLKKIVLVDDQRAFRQSFKLLLRKVGGASVVAEYDSGEEFLKNLNKQFSADIVFICIELAGFTGIETIRKAVKKMPDIVMIGMSVYQDKIYVEQAIEAGARGYLLKFSDNFSILDTIIRFPKAEIFYSSEVNPLGNIKFSKKFRVILTDDSESSLFVSEYILQNEGFEVVSFLSAFDALSFAQKSSDACLVITDYIMPEISGIQFSQKIRQIRNYKKVPVMLLSAFVNNKVLSDASENGINLVLKKPFLEKELVSAAEKLIFEKKI